ncbi:MAG: GrpB family protein [Actinomycetota bacterium]|nr:GrpB family protein [Actinomycetota bacterium]
MDEILARTAAELAPVVVSEYDDEWPRLFARIAEPVRRALGDVAAAVEHVGSTAVPGLAAKPVIDVDVVVRSAADVPVAVERLRGLGYVYQGDKGIPGREAFARPRGAPRHHLYVVVAGSAPHADHLAFRDYLREHPDVAREYAALKRELANRHAGDREAYTDAKADFVARVLAAARR